MIENRMDEYLMEIAFKYSGDYAYEAALDGAKKVMTLFRKCIHVEDGAVVMAVEEWDRMLEELGMEERD